MTFPANKSLQKKRVARIAAVQSLYAHALNPGKAGVPAMVSMMIAHWQDSLQNDEPELAFHTTPDSALLERILRTALGQRTEIETHIDTLLIPGWRKDRMSEALLSNLRAFAAELLSRPEAKIAMLIGEYTEVAAAFVSDQELAFIHSALNHIAHALRTTEVPQS